MICPSCKSDMIVVEHKKIELDYCPNCHGAWFDSGELELFLESLNLEKPEQFVGNMLNSPEPEILEKSRKCPICSQRMKKIIVGEKPGILIDVCRKGDGLWFDGGEIDQLAKQLSKKPSKESQTHDNVSSFLGEVFKSRDTQ